jgi:DNA repair protein RadA/Sms
MLIQAAQGIADTGRTVMYVTSEESPGQIKMRAGRLGISGERVIVDAQTNLEVILNHIREIKPAVVMIDSVQLIYKPTLPAAPGSVSQLRQCGTELVWLAKSTGTTVVLVGHVTKQGTIAGPKILEHIVDVVLYFEGDYHQSHRLIRAAKNRFGATNELGIFEMSDRGLVEITDPAGLFLQRGYSQRPGSVILSASEGTRILLVEVQGLTAPAAPGMTRRKATGVDANRLAMILAVLERHVRLKLSTKDVFVNVVGGVKVNEPAADLGIALAVAGAYTSKTLPQGTAVFGELGLSGELRPVPFGENRINEAIRLGLTRLVFPTGTAIRSTKFEDSQIIPCQNLSQVMELMG